jgi:RHS repeat-associated protein
VIGISDTASSGYTRAFLWQNGTMMDLGASPHNLASDAFGINDGGQVVGATDTGNAFLWQGGQFTNLGTLSGGNSSAARAINDAGQVVGQSSTANNGPFHAVLWQNGTIRDLGTQPGDPASYAYAINSAGQVVGYSGLAGPGPSLGHAFLWQGGTMTGLGTLPGGGKTAAYGINASGEVVGEAVTASGSTHAVVWQNGVITDLGTLGGTTSVAYGINASGQVVGYSYDANGNTDVVLWQNGAIYDLGSVEANGVIPPAAAINDSGDIVGTLGLHALLTHAALPADTPPRSCVCGNSAGLRQSNPGVNGYPTSVVGSHSPGSGVSYPYGTVSFPSSELSSDGFGTPWGQTLDWTNQPGYVAGGFNGSGQVSEQQPFLRQVHAYYNNTLINQIIVSSSATNALYFDQVGSTYVPHYFIQDQLTDNTGANEFVLTDTTGDQIRFNDFSAPIPPNARGQLKSFTDPYGNVTRVVSLTSDGKIQEVQRTDAASGAIESYLYTYLPSSDPNAGLLANVTLRRMPPGGQFSTIRQVAYAYYGANEANGNLGDLKTASVEDGAQPPNVLDITYYRYYKPGETYGYAHGLKYLFNPQSYARLQAGLVGTSYTPFTAPDASVAPYADNYFKYDDEHRVTTAVVQGAGSSSANGGLGTFTYSYTVSTNPLGFNSWTYKTVETLPDSTSNVVYCNAIGEVMLTVHRQTGGSWETFYEYDSAGRLILTANPSALSGYNELKADLIDKVQTGDYGYLNATTGLVRTTEYYATTSSSIGESTPGGVAGYEEAEFIQQGQSGTPILQSSTQYFAHAAGGITVYPVASDTVYRNTDGTGAETTNYAYTWYAGTVGVQSQAVSRPPITAAQNGPGVADVDSTYYDSYGRPTWTRDADGFLTYTQYDPATGAVVKTITDVDTTRSGDFQNLPAGWTTPPGGGLHLITQMQVDSLGRDTAVTDPNGNLTYTVYDDPNHEVRVYPGWQAATGMPTGPTQVWREDRAHSTSYTETLTMSAQPHLNAAGQPDGTEPISNVDTLSREFTSPGGQVIESDAYFNLSSTPYNTNAYLGTAGTTYYSTAYGYDAGGREYRVVSPTGTVTQADYDGLDRVIDVQVGTTTTPLVMTSQYVYDQATPGGAGGVGDGNLTQVTQFPSGSSVTTNKRVTENGYDWRDRLVATKAGVQSTEDTTTHRPLIFTTYDNLDEAVEVQQYDGDGQAVSPVNPQPPAATRLRAQAVAAYDDQGRVYQTQTFDVNPATGAVSSTALTTNGYFDHRGDLIAESAPGGLWTKHLYDGAGRDVMDYTTDGASGTSWAAAASPAGDNVLEQTQTVYDANGNAIETINKQRFHDETAQGPLGDPATSPRARVSYVASYYDAADRLTATVNVGTNGGTAWARPATPPTPSDTALVTSDTYNAAGWVQDVLDPRNIDTRTLYDNLGRVTETIAAYTGNPETAESDVATEYTYDGDNHVLTVKADEPGGTSYQETEYVYGVTTATGSGLNSNDLLAQVQHPNPLSGAPDANASDHQQDHYTYNALGQVTSMTDRNGNVHQYSYDVLGRLTSDAVTTLGMGVNGSARQIAYAYDTQGNQYLATSYNAATGGTVVNQVQQVYNGLGQLTGEYQSHAGSVVTSGTNPTPEVQYAYTEMAGGVNNSRLVSMTYPSGYVLNFNYAQGLDSSISRLTSLSDAGSPVTGPLESYKYLGLATVVERDHAQPNVNLSYTQQPGDPSANHDAGDPYTGLDRFGRVIDQNWVNATTGQSTDRFQYGYDRDSNRLSRTNVVDAAFTEQYQYDNLNQLTNFQRGSHSQNWSLDALGNWNSVTTDGTTQTRSTNQQNELTTISGAGTVSYDANGNLTADGSGKTYVYDAWNRLVAVKNGSTTLAAYSYDALGRRITETHGSTTTDLYYSSAWQVLEERVNGVLQARNIWSPVYVDALVLRDQSSQQNGTLDQRLYVQQDANWNVTALVNTAGTVVERYVYDPYGQVTILNPDWTRRTGSGFAWVYMHQGGRYDNATGLYSFRNRDYSPALGRWLEKDPLGFDAGDTNIYRFVGNRPINATDPTGLEPQEVMDPRSHGQIRVWITEPKVPIEDLPLSSVELYSRPIGYFPSWWNDALTLSHGFLVVRGPDGSITTYTFGPDAQKGLQADKDYANMDRWYWWRGTVKDYYRENRLGQLPLAYVDKAFKQLTQQESYNPFFNNCYHVRLKIVQLAAQLYIEDLKAELDRATAELDAARNRRGSGGFGDLKGIERSEERIARINDRILTAEIVLLETWAERLGANKTTIY